MNKDEFHKPGNHKIFVFGSNLAGRHGAGAALYAKRYCGAIEGQGLGLQGKSYAIPTKDKNIHTLDLWYIEAFVKNFLDHARYIQPEVEFYVSELGTGLAGYRIADIAPFFRHSPPNVELPATFRKFLNDQS